MKCDHCPLSCSIMTDCGNEWECGAGYEEPPIEFKDGLNGCRLRRKTVERVDEAYCYMYDGKMPKELSDWLRKYNARKKKEERR